MRSPAKWPPDGKGLAGRARLIELIRLRLDIDRLTAAAIETGARAVTRRCRAAPFGGV